MVNPPEADFILRRMSPLSYLAYKDSRMTQQLAARAVEPDSGPVRRAAEGRKRCTSHYPLSFRGAHRAWVEDVVVTATYIVS